MLIDYRSGCITVLDRDGVERAACDDYKRSREEYERLLGQSATDHTASHTSVGRVEQQVDGSPMPVGGVFAEPMR